MLQFGFNPCQCLISVGAWRPYKELLSIVEKAVYRKRPEVFHELDVALKKYKPDFLSLLKNPVRRFVIFWNID